MSNNDGRRPACPIRCDSFAFRHVPLLKDPNQPPLKHARARPVHLPSPSEPGYQHYVEQRERALEPSVRILAQCFAHDSGVECWKLENDRLIVYQHSQSKLSQQELSDLQKATHFDKKELQQWYKGAQQQTSLPPPTGRKVQLTRTLVDRLLKGLPLRYAHQGRVPEDLQAVLPLR